MGLVEFCPSGPRVVRKDAGGYFVKWSGDRFYDHRLGPYEGRKVHVMTFLDGSGYQVSEWLDPAEWCRGGWKIRAGDLIVTDAPTAADEKHLSRWWDTRRRP